MNESIDFYVPIIDNYGDIGFALNLALIMTSKNPKLKVRFFSDDEELFDKMMGNNIKGTTQNVIAKYEAIQNSGNNIENGLLHTSQGQCSEIQGRFPSSREGQFIQFSNLNDLSNYIPSKFIFTFFDYKLHSEYLKKGEKGKTIIQFGYFLLHKGIENLHNTSYEIDGNKFIHFIPSLRKNTGGIIIQNNLKKNSKEEYLNYLKSKYDLNIEIDKEILEKKWISVFVYKDTLNEIIEKIQERKDEVFFLFENKKTPYPPLSRGQLETENIIYLPFFKLLDYNDFLSVCDCNIVRGENSLCTSLSLGKPTLWDIYKEDNEAHNEKIQDFLEFLEENKIQELVYAKILKKFNLKQKKEAFTDFLDNYQNYNNLFQNLGNYINNNCDLYKNIKKIF